MKTYIWNDTKPFNGKVNFVDSNNVILGYDLNQDCCEHAFWTISKDPRGKELVIEGDKQVGEEIELENYWFDTDFFERDDNEGQEEYVAVFRLRNSWKHSGQPLYIRLENHHNGYYSHGFAFSGASKISDSL